MEIVRTIPAWKKIRTQLDHDRRTLGFVATMGTLHNGHLALVERSLRENDRTVVSIFVNPSQFNDPTDLETYPRTVEQDRRLLENLDVDYTFAPEYETLYPDDYHYRVSENDYSLTLCGAHRPGHFDGVLTVVMRLFNIIRPHNAYFGEKDFQQYRLIRGMVDTFFMDLQVIPCPIVREDDGLALSSRNQRLSQSGRELAGKFAESLTSSRTVKQIRSDLQELGISVDYIEETEGRRFGAVVIEDVRLIDNRAM